MVACFLSMVFFTIIPELCIPPEPLPFIVQLMEQKLSVTKPNINRKFYHVLVLTCSSSLEMCRDEMLEILNNGNILAKIFPTNI